MPSALPNSCGSLRRRSHVTPFIYWLFIGQPESSICVPDAEATLKPLASRDPRAESEQKTSNKLVIKTWTEIYKFRDTYVRSFRAFIPIAARFDLEPIKYDIVNAFLKTCLCHLVIEELARSLNRIGPLAEYRVLRELGFQPISHEPCCSTRDGILVFFYVDDIDSPFDRIGKHWLEDWSNNQRHGIRWREAMNCNEDDDWEIIY